jgi:hypothetical protein
MDFSKPLASEPELRQWIVRFVGGTAAVTKSFGVGVTVTYVSAGLVDLVFADPLPGPYVGVLGYCFDATTAANVKSYILTTGAFNTTTRTLRLNMFEAGTLTDLAALENLTVTLGFKATGA